MADLFNYNHALGSLTIVRGSLPFDTGNLRFNATRLSYSHNSFEITIDGDIAPYFVGIDEKARSKNYVGGFERASFAPVFRHLERTIGGRFAGGRFLVKKTISYNDAYQSEQLTRDANLLQRQRVFEKYNYREG